MAAVVLGRKRRRSLTRKLFDGGNEGPLGRFWLVKIQFRVFCDSFVEGEEVSGHYDLLGLSRDAGYVEIRSAYRRMALLTHPAPWL